ncbi:hypothetical protein DWX91_13850 [Clostridium sp. AF22-10]|nr:hypothetical protein DWX91_13850 [Clostridium sp. AF22-10]
MVNLVQKLLLILRPALGVHMVIMVLNLLLFQKVLLFLMLINRKNFLNVDLLMDVELHMHLVQLMGKLILIQIQ